MWGPDRQGVVASFVTAFAVLLVVGGAVPVGAVGGPDGHATGGASVDLDVCLVVLDATVALDASFEEGVESSIDVDLDTCIGDGDGWPPGGDDPTPPGTPTPTDTPTPTESPPDDGDDGDDGDDNDGGSDGEDGEDNDGGSDGEDGDDDGDNDGNGNDGSDDEGGNDGSDDDQGDDDADGDGGDDDDSTDDDEPNAAPPIEVVSWQVEPKRVTVGEPVVVEATYRNPYWAQQSTIVELTVDGKNPETERLGIPGDGTETATFEYVLKSPGRHRVGIGGLGTEAVRVVATPTATPSATPTAAPGSTATETRQQEAAGFDGGGLFAVGLLVSSLLGLAGFRLWRSTPKP